MALYPMDLNPMKLDPMELDPMDLDPVDFGCGPLCLGNRSIWVPIDRGPTVRAQRIVGQRFSPHGFGSGSRTHWLGAHGLGTNAWGGTHWGPTIRAPRFWELITHSLVRGPRDGSQRLGGNGLGASYSRTADLGADRALTGWKPTGWGPTVGGQRIGGQRLSHHVFGS